MRFPIPEGRQFPLPLLTACVLLLASPATGESVSAYLQKVGSADFLLVSEKTPEMESAGMGLFSVQLCKELGLASVSLWKVRPSSLDESASEPRLAVFEWVDSQAAFAAYTNQVTEVDPWAVQWTAESADALRTNDQLLGWKGRFFLRLLPEEKASADLQSLFQEVLESIEQESLYPFTVSQLPEEGMLRQSRRYYLGPISLGSDSTFSQELLERIGFEQGVEAAAATYEPGPVRLFVLGYPNSSVALRFHDELLAESGSILAQEDIQVKLTGPLLCLVRGPVAQARRLLDRVEYEAEIQWLYDKPKADKRRDRSQLLSFFSVITSSIIFSVLALGVLILAGLGVGALRFAWHQRFPSALEKGEMIRMSIDTRRVLAHLRRNSRSRDDGPEGPLEERP